MKESNIVLHTNKGDIALKLDFENTPVTAENFLNYVKSGYYTNTIFHRVIEGFMIQGGGFEVGMKQKSTQASIANEGKTGQKNKRGTLAMARTSDPHSASAQFFINLVDNDFLNYSSETERGWGYCVFATVTSGMDIVDQIGKVATTVKNPHRDVPADDIIITSAEVVA